MTGQGHRVNENLHRMYPALGNSTSIRTFHSPSHSDYGRSEVKNKTYMDCILFCDYSFQNCDLLVIIPIIKTLFVFVCTVPLFAFVLTVPIVPYLNSNTNSTYRDRSLSSCFLIVHTHPNLMVKNEFLDHETLPLRFLIHIS